MEKFYSIFYYQKFNYLSVQEKSVILSIYDQFRDKFYLKKGIKDGYHMSFNGLCSKKDAEMIVKILEENISMPDFDEDEYHRLFSKISDPNYTGVCNKNKISIKEEKMPLNFQNMSQYFLYRDMSIALDSIFINNYFEKNNLQLVYDFINLEYKNYGSSKMYNSHLSHLWAYISNLNLESQNKFKKLLSNKLKEINENELVFNPESEFLKQFSERIKIMISLKEIDFFSPSTLSKTITLGFASPEHRNTIQFADEYQYDKDIITNRWFLNLLYEKLLLLNFNILDKYTLNYIFGAKDSNSGLLDRL
ncbi:hypothetical protein [Streptococcus ruminantium]|uniref:hypothetical protein n=1 Tax=Streptococcus ruminantium TaxID=1917441 RepID=UPI001F28D56D|nr:hypothetical protein [Streptococcus ruminantium]BDD38503.1 hypothetical protein GUT183_07410 [Streptococcus ruminantium]